MSVKQSTKTKRSANHNSGLIKFEHSYEEGLHHQRSVVVSVDDELREQLPQLNDEQRAQYVVEQCFENDFPSLLRHEKEGPRVLRSHCGKPKYWIENSCDQGAGWAFDDTYKVPK